MGAPVNPQMVAAYLKQARTAEMSSRQALISDLQDYANATVKYPERAKVGAKQRTLGEASDNVPPGGSLTLKVDWNFESKLPPLVLHQDGYQYVSSAAHFSLPKLFRPELGSDVEIRIVQQRISTAKLLRAARRARN
jgi:hypothetical protein